MAACFAVALTKMWMGCWWMISGAVVQAAELATMDTHSIPHPQAYQGGMSIRNGHHCFLHWRKVRYNCVLNTCKSLYHM